MSFDFKKYIIRVIKYLVYIFILTSLMLILIALITKQPLDLNILLQPGSVSKIGVILGAFSLIYPMVGFTSLKVYINNSFEQDREKIERVFTDSRYIVVKREENTISFRHSSPFSRLLNLYEDTIILDFSENPLTLTGARKNVTRFSRMITYAVTERTE